jgi:hypothetical protein
MPVHNWITRHLCKCRLLILLCRLILCVFIDKYTCHSWPNPPPQCIDYPLIRMQVPKITATFLVFFFSAAMHELIIALPFRYIAFHAFVGMMFQAPLIFITKYVDRKLNNAVLGNIIFWLVFCVLGQPMGVILYNYDLWKITGAVQQQCDTMLSNNSCTSL